MAKGFKGLKGLAGLSLACLAVVSVAAPGSEATVQHEVVPGDTLIGLAHRLLEEPSQWRGVARLNGVREPRRLKPGSRLHIPVAWLRGQARPAAVLYVRGQVMREVDAARSAVRIGDVLQEGDTLHVGPDSYASLRLHDGSQVHVQTGTVVRLERLRAVPETGKTRASLGLGTGRLDNRVAPQRKGSRFDVRTPLAVAGVRGTEFGVSADMAAGLVLTDVAEGAVAVSAAAGAGQAGVAAGQGAVVRLGAKMPQVRPLLPAPDLTALPARQERLPWLMSWPLVAEAVDYRVQVAQDEDLTRVVTSVERARPPLRLDDLADGEYVVSVRARDADGLLGAEARRRVRLKTTPAPPLARSPGPRQVVAIGPVALQCTEVPQAGAYRWQVAKGEGDWPAGSAGGTVVATVQEHRTQGHCALTVDAETPGQYRWRVATRVLRGDGTWDEGPFSDTFRFQAVPAPEAPVPLVEVGDEVRIHWEGGSAGDRFEVQVSPDASFQQGVQTHAVTQAEARWPMPSWCQPHYVRLRRVSAEGLASAFSPPRLLNAEPMLCTADGHPALSGDGARVRLGGH